MMVFTCNSCTLVIRVMGDAQQVSFLIGEGSSFWPDKYKCPRCSYRALPIPADEVSPELLADANVLHLEAEEMYAALNGLGLPEERVATKTAVEHLLYNHRVVRVGGETSSNTNRCRIDWLDLDDGTRLFFAAGGRGAVVYRIRRRFSYVEETDGKDSARVSA